MYSGSPWNGSASVAAGNGSASSGYVTSGSAMATLSYGAAFGAPPFMMTLTLPAGLLWSHETAFRVSPSAFASVTGVDVHGNGSAATATMVFAASTSGIDTSVTQSVWVSFNATEAVAVSCGSWAATGSGSDLFSLAIVLQGSQRSTLSSGAVTAVTSVAVATSAVAGAMGSPTAALQQIRVTGLLGLGDCEYSDAAPLSMTSNPLQLAAGRASGQYYRGAVVGSVVISSSILGLCGVVVGAVALRRSVADARRGVSVTAGGVKSGVGTVWQRLQAAAADVHFPGMLVVPLTLGVQTTVTAALELLQLQGADAADIATGLVGLMGVGASMGAVAVVLSPRCFDCHLAARAVGHSVYITVLGETRLSRMLTWALVSDQKWVNSGEHRAATDGRSSFKQHYLLLFAEYRMPRYMLFELGVAGVTGVILGVKNTTSSACLGQTIGIFVVNVVALVVVVAYRPAMSRSMHAYMVLSNGLSCVCAVTSFGNVLSDSDVWGKISDALTVFVSVLGALKVLLDVITGLVFVVGFAKMGGASRRQRKTLVEADRLGKLGVGTAGDWELPLLQVHTVALSDTSSKASSHHFGSGAVSNSLTPSCAADGSVNPMTHHDDADL